MNNLVLKTLSKNWTRTIAYKCLREQETSVLESYLNFGEEDDWDISTNVDEVKEMLSKLPCKSGGPDNFPSRLLSLAASILAGPICHLFLVSVQERPLPNL